VATAPNLNDIDEIRRRMAQIRRDLHQDVKEVVAGAEAVTDWRRYIRSHPWVAVGIAAGIGYLIVPKRRPRVPRDVARQSDVAEVREVLTQARERGEEAEKRRKSLLGAAFGMVAPLAWRVVQNYAVGYLEHWIAQQQQQYMATAGPPPVSPSTSGGPGPGPARPRGSPPGGSSSTGGAGWPGGPHGS
jgi:hypothetical protein